MTKTALERLDELEKQVNATQLSHVDLEARVLMLDAVLGFFMTTGQRPSQLQLTRFMADVVTELNAKYPGLNIQAKARPAAPPTLIVPTGAVH